MTSDRYNDMPAPDNGIEDPPRELPEATEADHVNTQLREQGTTPAETDIEDPPRESDLPGVPPVNRRAPLPREENDPFLRGRVSGLTNPSDTEEA